MIEVIKGDITKIKVDAIVNAANTSLLGGSGVDGAIHKAGGGAILEDCKKIRSKQGGCKVGEAVITTAGKLPAKFVIHTVGPVWNNGNNNEDMLLSLAYSNSLKLAADHNVQTISFPNISTGIYRFPKYQAAKIAFKTVTDFQTTSDLIKQIIFVCFDIENYNIYNELLKSENIDFK
ncbi:O-acetyl-ADP-ribose deacetylase (regulator of RNase III), contains Macro domain [Chitinophaga costaii]|uniref:O-acetyl-ADP-ribose deacetylase (Regulator of RNase III), contains Macro domain n=1 Tax=Chitinophaga costaii TaxID=1335309 RepID=A0A1C4ESX9_9BACT|nr:O-acetyl-ADP-ribose deacetylase [Chitinophaga costaii]PUZ22569.1 O-acetyl-ADP-ribose deacetylase [Chitinophaga costaii]SCC46633.1 O-acetyl-ADP-ribose deacetylase (regulator of RNase III), contains Macro domain [Chitinophaga costaii]